MIPAKTVLNIPRSEPGDQSSIRDETPVAVVSDTSALQSKERSDKNQHFAIGYARAFVTILVVAHHAALAYHAYAPPVPPNLGAEPRLWRAFPIVDSHRWSGATLLVGFNDVFFMSLMFFLSGLFVWNSLERKGPGLFLRDRLRRLGVPFVVAAVLLAPLAYYPSYLVMTGANPTFFAFARQWLALPDWPAGPAWFLWVLLSFDALAAGLFLCAPKFGVALGRLSSNASRHPIAFFSILAAASAATYIPMSQVFGSTDWFDFGLFQVQKSRVLHYLVYFMAGISVGAFGISEGLLAADGRLSRRWPLWLASSVVLFGAAVAILIMSLNPKSGRLPWDLIGGCAFVFSCAASSFAVLAVFMRFATARMRILDSLADNAYGIYLLHYAFVIWLQYALLPFSIFGVGKFAIVFLGTLLLSWAAAAALRRIPGVGI